MISRRVFLKGLLALSAAGALTGGYAVAEPFRLNVTRYRVSPRNWPKGLSLRLAVIADLHVCEPWMNLERVSRIVARTNALGADAILLLGDYIPSSRMRKISALIPGANPVPDDDWAGALGRLSAPLGVHAVLGNHDWWQDAGAMARRAGPTAAGEALQRAGINLLENQAVRFEKDGQGVWIAGLGDQWAFFALNFEEAKKTGFPYEGIHDVAGTLAQVTDDGPVIMMAHEPDIFASMPERVSLTLSGHTHGGQVRLLGYAPVVPSRFGRRYDYGHIVEDGRHLVVSGGLGCSVLPIRFGVPPEIVVVDLGDSVREGVS